MRRLFRAMTGRKIATGVQVVITRMMWCCDINGDTGCTVLKETSRLAHIQWVNEAGTLTVQLMAHRSHAMDCESKTRTDSNGMVNGATETCKIPYIAQVSDTGWYRVFSEAEIVSFVENVGDMNPIHRESPYIVPGCLLLEWIHKYMVPTATSIRLRFLHAICAGDLVEFHRDGDRLIVMVGNRQVVSGIIYKQ